ncbi:hypothetical protein [Anaeromyxobacter dehalogenans]|uniref:Lipoprotein n=1 Tax=Anaeromyxobacter dehalogenans (strain 2CP-C) TaxID=290397 RepID=Q2IIC7_ANADE|nr:hypothetical protein [Anaeromyxobacter dehalogenans]ABC81410.1 hypothetical protein Adeh_1637 [Anaeromyxobacter dehalogenans 2CP-C]
MTLRTLVPILALALACARAPAPAAPRAAAASPAEYFPLAVGNTWTYVDESPALPPERRGATRTVRILERTADGYFRDSDRGELRADGGCVHDRLRRLLCAPLAQGQQWSSVVSASSTERYEIAAVGETAETPAGRFEGCVRVRAHNRAGPTTDNVLEITYAPGVGPVRIETWAVVEGNVAPQVRAVLGSYRVGGK